MSCLPHILKSSNLGKQLGLTKDTAFNTIAEIRELIDSKNLQELKPKVDNQITDNNIELENTKKEQDSQNEYYTQQSLLKRISNDYFEYKKVSSVLTNLQNLLQLVKGFKNTFSESEKFIRALNDLGYSINENYTDIKANVNINDKFYDNYQNTLKILPLDKEGKNQVDKILNDKFLKQNIKTAIDLLNISKKYFISETDIAKETKENVTNLFKDYKQTNLDFQNNLRKQYLSFLTVSAYIESVKNTDDKLPNIEDFLLTPLQDIIEDNSKEFNDLQKSFLQIINYNNNNGIKNNFLNVLELKNIDYNKKQTNKNTLYGYRLHTFITDARKIKNPDLINNLISDFNALYFANNNNITAENEEEIRMNNIKTQFAKDIFKFLIVKDGLMYRNTSFIKAIDPILFTETSNSLDKVQELFNKTSTQEEFINTFGKTKEELDLDFIMKFGLHQDNYFDLKSQNISILLEDINKQKKEDDKNLENENEIINNDEDNIETVELSQADNYPIFFNNVERSLTINQFARITQNMSNDEKKEKIKENKKFIYRDANVIFKKIKEPFKFENNDKTFVNNKIGFPLLTYLTTREKGKRIPLKLSIVQNTIKVNNNWITYQITSEGKIVNLTKSTKKGLSEKIFYNDLLNNTIYEIINKSVKLKTFNNNQNELIDIVKAIANQFKTGYITGTKARYDEHIILGSSELSSFSNDIETQTSMTLSEDKTKNIKLDLFNKEKVKEKDDIEIRKNLINLYNEHSNLTKLTLDLVKEYSVEKIKNVVNNLLIQKTNLSEKDINEKMKKCFG